MRISYISKVITVSFMLAQAQLTLAKSEESIIGKNQNFTSAGKTRAEMNVNKGTILYPSNIRYGFKHMEEFLPTKSIDKGGAAEFNFKKATNSVNLDNFNFEYKNYVTGKKTSSTVGEMLKNTSTDALVVLKDGQLVYEKYFDGQNQRTQHQLNSVTKSFAGTIAAILISEDKLNRAAKVSEYLPELKNSAYGDATVDQVLDMTVGLKYSEDYADPKSEVSRYIPVIGLTDKKNETTMLQFLQSLKKKGEHGEKFHYVTPNTDVVCLLNEKASGKSFDQLLSEKIWSKIGATRDAYVLVTPNGTPFCGGGLNATAIDLAKYGQTLLNGGTFNGQEIIPKQLITEVENGGDLVAFARSQDEKSIMKGWSYKNQYWVRGGEDKAYMAIGVYGQWIYINPKERVVIVKQSSLPNADNSEIDSYTIDGFDAIIRALKK
ncbi:serine hydrolase domain-containing protein [Acinetobacter sp. YK3]|uniref:serine hydrolase domain-containing protein n=1 Tax=Acinetobacter sp. YK3 TaxID=1860097 RepID=UPI00084C9B9A|nr:serine hydrolase [Acinetobacter sp. YK3]OEC91458.1 hypothetical protein A9Z07_17060 [Acinetobacter sp. YK3]